MKLLIALSLLLVVFVILLVHSKQTSLAKAIPNTLNSSVAEVTPMPFYEITIPYFRGRIYKSSIGELEKIGDNGSYDMFLTDYDSDGFKINALLTIPNGEAPEGGWPAIVFVHGYIPPGQYVTTERYGDYVDYLANNEFVVFKIDLRGHGDSEGKAGGSYYGSDYVIDILNAYGALQSSNFVNKKKIGLWGHSMAGNIVLRSLASKPEIPAAVIWAGAGFSYVDLQKYQIRDASYHPLPSDTERARRQRLIFELYGRPTAESSFWKQVAPTNYLNDLKGAIQLDHAVDDETVDIGYSRDLNSLLDKTSVPHEFYEYPNGGHNISGNNFTLAMQRTVEFFKRYLDLQL